jgi:hypothetical protein
MKPMMKCGHTANAIKMQKDGPSIPACAICSCYEIAEEVPNLEGREAKCGCCGHKKPSDFNLAFFEYKGEGSKFAKTICKHCRYSIVAHSKEKYHGAKWCDNFESFGPNDSDAYYCGCRGWN